MIAKGVAEELGRNGVVVDETRNADQTVSLKERSDLENRGAYDYFISLHRNAFKPEQAKGVETYIYLNPQARTRDLAEKIQAALVDVGFVNRGVKAANFHVLRETKAPALLVEIGFIDNFDDNQLFDTRKDEIIRSLTKAILAHLGTQYLEKPPTPLQPKEQQSNQVLYRVLAGSYAIRGNAEQQVERLKAAGFDAAIMVFQK